MEEPTSRLDTSDGDSPRTFVLSGEIDSHTAPTLDQHLEAIGTDDDVVLDVAGVEFVDSSGLRVVIAWHQRLDEVGNRLVLRSPSQPLVRLLEITGLTGHLHTE